MFSGSLASSINSMKKKLRDSISLFISRSNFYGIHRSSLCWSTINCKSSVNPLKCLRSRYFYIRYQHTSSESIFSQWMDNEQHLPSYSMRSSFDYIDFKFCLYSKNYIIFTFLHILEKKSNISQDDYNFLPFVI